MRVESNGPGFGCQGLRNPVIIEDGLSLGLWYTQHLCFALGWAHRAVAQFGSAPALGAGCRRFKSCQPDRSPTPAWGVGVELEIVLTDVVAAVAFGAVAEAAYIV